MRTSRGSPARRRERNRRSLDVRLLEFGILARDELQKDVVAARAIVEELKAVAIRTHDDLSLAFTIWTVGDLERHLGNLDEARARYVEAERLFRKERSDFGLANTIKADR